MIELRIKGVRAEDEDQISELLASEGAVAITLMDAADRPILEPMPGETPLWPDIEIQALFEEASLALSAEKILKTHYPALICQSSTLEEQPWELAWQMNAKPLCFGKRLWVCPSVVPIPDPSAVNIVLDPGLAFGTGTHPTTALCLRWLDANDVSGKTLIDYGCGSGILGLAALKLGAHKVYAIDIDPQALSATKQNAIQNKLDLTQLHLGAPPSEPVDFILANILLNPLIALKHDFRTLLKPSGRLVISGILREQMLTLQAAYADVFDFEYANELDDWAMLVFCNSPARQPEVQLI